MIRWKLSLFRVSKAFSVVYKPVFFRQLVMRDPAVWNRLWKAKTGLLTLQKDTAQLIKKIVFDFKFERQKSVKRGEKRRSPPKPITQLPPAQRMVCAHLCSPKWLSQDQEGENLTLAIEIHHASAEHISHILRMALSSNVMPTNIHLRNPLFNCDDALGPDMILDLHPGMRIIRPPCLHLQMHLHFCKE
jgi:hypothetical protein